MSIQVEFLGPLSRLTEGRVEVFVDAGSVIQAFRKLEERYEGLSKQILDKSGNVHRHINISVNEEDIRFSENLQTSLKPGDVVTIISSIAGG